MCNKKDLYLDRVYKLCAPLMLVIVTYSYVFSVKPIFDKQQELNEKSSLADTLTTEVHSLEKEKKVALNKLHETEEDLKAASVKLNLTDDTLEQTTKILVQVNSKLDSAEAKLAKAELKLKHQTKDISVKEAQLEQLLIDVGSKNEKLLKLNESLNNSENAAVSFYIYRVVNEVANNGISAQAADLYGRSTNPKKFNLYNALMEKSKFNDSEPVDKFSQEYFERKAKVIIRQFTEENISIDENSYKPAFDLYVYTFRKQMGILTE